MAETELKEYYQNLFNLAIQNSSHYPENRYSGRGIVICGGGETYFACAWVCINVLRYHKCLLPIEFWYLGQAEMSVGMINLMADLGVTCQNAYDYTSRYPVKNLNNWELKPYAIIHSSFEEVLYIDADNVAVRNPAFLFEEPPYQKNGCIFWPDRYFGDDLYPPWLKKEAWEVCMMEYRKEPEFETGQMLINKRKCWSPLQLTMHLNDQSEYYYNFFYGDKDTFHLAWRKMEKEYALVPHRPENLEIDKVILQFDFKKKLLFQHRNGSKWSFHLDNERIKGFQLDEICLGFIEELKKKWNGYCRDLPKEYTPKESKIFDKLTKNGPYLYFLDGYLRNILVFQTDWTINDGSSLMERFWKLEEKHDGRICLVIKNAGGPTCFLHRHYQNCWSGKWLSYSRYSTMLFPMQDNSHERVLMEVELLVKFGDYVLLEIGKKKLHLKFKENFTALVDGNYLKWGVRADEKTCDLVLLHRLKPLYRFEKVELDKWLGRSFNNQSSAVTLQPLASF